VPNVEIPIAFRGLRVSRLYSNSRSELLLRAASTS
jgi:hypothetical protein